MSHAEGEAISSTQSSMVLDLPPSCIEFCPAHPRFFVVGTYNLEKSRTEDEEIPANEDDGDGEGEPAGTEAIKQRQSRNGSIVVLELRDGKVYPIETIPQSSAVFDLHFSPIQGRGDIFAAVSSTGTIPFYRLVVHGDAAGAPSLVGLEPLSVLTIPDLSDDVLFTSFAWHPTIPGLMAITTAGGRVILAQIHDDYHDLDVLENAIIEHSLEAWAVAFSPPPPPSTLPASPTTFTIFSGGDDSALRYTTYAPPPAAAAAAAAAAPPPPPTALPGRHHTAGVTAVLPLPVPHLVLTGSYDGTLRLFRLAPRPAAPAAAAAPPVLAAAALGGGVWRLGAIAAAPSTAAAAAAADGRRWAVYVLASCMHAGARVLRITAGGAQAAAAAAPRSVGIDVLARFEAHQSMNYGSDWSRAESRLPANGQDGTVVCVSTSFYDKLLCVWTARVPSPAWDA